MELDEFQSIGPGIYLHEPSPSPPPTLIILCTWLGGATPRRIAKYTAGYRDRFPKSAILLLTTTIPDICILPLSVVRARLAPAYEVITRFLHPHFTPEASYSGSNHDPKSPGGSEEENRGSILLHVFSHGGSNIGIQLARALRETNPNTHELFTNRLKLLVLDCCPGDNSFRRSYDAAAVSLPGNTLLTRSLGRGLLYPVIGTLTTLQSLGVLRNVWDLRRDLNDEGAFGKKARRLYLYSREDEMVPWRMVEGHVLAARAKGYVTDGVRFDKGAHCALVMADERGYWEGIGRAWAGKSISDGKREIGGSRL